MMYELIFILNNMETFKWSDALFLPENEVWDKHTKGLIQDPDDIENDEDELPKAAIENHFIYTLSIQSIQLIVENAKRQKQNISDDDLLEAFLFYYDHDAYMDFSDKNTMVQKIAENRYNRKPWKWQNESWLWCMADRYSVMVSNYGDNVWKQMRNIRKELYEQQEDVFY